MVLVASREIDLLPGETYTFFFETPRELGVVQSIVFWWDARFLIINPLEWLRTHYIYLDGGIMLTEQDERVSVFTPARAQVEEEKDLHATLSHSFEQRR